MKLKKATKQNLKRVLPYFFASTVIIALVAVGSIDKKHAIANRSFANFSRDNYSVSVDQLSGLYAAATISDAMNLANADDIASSYVIATAVYDAGQTTVGKLEKPNIIFSSSRGIITYVAVAGDTVASVAAKYGLTTTQVRWSNGLKANTIPVGKTLYIPSTPGIVYAVKAGDTIDKLASKYGSPADQIIAYNDLEVDTNLIVGSLLVLPNGVLPTKERPEYVAPVFYHSFTYSGVYYKRNNLRYIARNFYDPNYAYPNPNPGVRGWCTWYAWYWRATDSRSLGQLGHEGRNARDWHRNYSYRGVGNTPVVGAVFQTPYGSGGYGHVGVVLSINNDGSITVREMNYAGRYVVTEAEIPAENVKLFNYIY